MQNNGLLEVLGHYFTYLGNAGFISSAVESPRSQASHSRSGNLEGFLVRIPLGFLLVLGFLIASF